jgi:hypothetical protein
MDARGRAKMGIQVKATVLHYWDVFSALLSARAH